MGKKSDMERRNFIRNSALGLGAGTTLASAILPSSHDNNIEPPEEKLSREVWIATFTLTKVEAENHEDMVEKVLGS